MKNTINLSNNIKFVLTEFIHLFIGFSLISGIFYLRFLPRISRDLYQNMTHTRILITCFILVCIIVNIYNTLKCMGLIETKEPTGIKKELKDLLELIVDYITFTLINVYQFVWHCLWKIVKQVTKKRTSLQYQTLRPIAIFCMKKKNMFLYYYMLICIKFIPRIIFLSLFSAEVFFYHHLDLTFRFIPFLLIIYLEPFFLFTLENYHNQYYNGVKSFLEFKDVDDPEDILYRFYPNVDEKNLPYGAKDFDDYFYNHYYIIQSIPFLLERYSKWKHNDFPAYFITLFLQFIRLQIYLFILIYGII